MKVIRLKHDWTQRQVEYKLGKGNSTVSSWEKMASPPLDAIIEFCDLLEMPLWQFFAPEDLIIPEMTSQQAEIFKLIQDADEDMKILFLDALLTVTKAYNLGKNNG
ncbi:MAG: helix-turn-helix transcriptional regulator [Spirochaetota bacterium]